MNRHHASRRRPPTGVRLQHLACFPGALLLPGYNTRAADSDACTRWNAMGNSLSLGIIAADGHVTLDQALMPSGIPGFGETFRIRLEGDVVTGPDGFRLVFSAVPNATGPFLVEAPPRDRTATYTALGTEPGIYFGLRDLPDGIGTTIEGGRDYSCIPFSLPVHAAALNAAAQQGALAAFRASMRAMSLRLSPPNRLPSIDGEPGSASVDDAVTPGHLPTERIEVFGNGARLGQQQEAVTGLPEYDLGSATGSAGIEYRITEGLRLGLGVALGDHRIELAGDARSVDLSTLAVQGYVVFRHQGFRGAAQFAVGELELTSRHPAPDGTSVEGHARGSGHGIVLELGHDFHAGRLVVGPVASLDLVSESIDAYAESGSATFNLRVERQEIRSLVSGIGASAAWPFRLHRRVTCEPRLVLTWNHDHLNEVGGTRFSLVSTPGLSFDTGAATAAPGRDFATLTASVTSFLGTRHRGHLDLAFESQLFRDGRTYSFLVAAAGWTF